MKEDTDPRMHSAEHILNQTMVRMFGCGRSFNAHIEKKKSKCDYHHTRDLTSYEIKEIQVRVNSIIDTDMPVREEYLSRREAEKHYDTKRLPPDTRDGVRIVKIGDYDACPCIGTHVSSTKEIGSFRITTKSFDNGVLRIRFKLSEESRET